MKQKEDLNSLNSPPVPWYAYLTLLLTVLFLSGLFTGDSGVFSALDYSNVLGKFGKLGTVTEGVGVKLASSFRGMGGSGVRDGFIISLTFAPAIMLAFGVIEIYNDFKGLDAAQKLFSPILKPLLGLPGTSALAMISSITSSDAGAGITKSLHDGGHLNDNQLIILTTFMFSAPSILVNLYALGAPLNALVPIQISIPLLVILAMKFFGAILCRAYLALTSKKKEANNVAK